MTVKDVVGRTSLRRVPFVNTRRRDRAKRPPLLPPAAFSAAVSVCSTRPTLCPASTSRWRCRLHRWVGIDALL